jgi:hypothetical protein
MLDRSAWYIVSVYARKRSSSAAALRADLQVAVLQRTKQGSPELLNWAEFPIEPPRVNVDAEQIVTRIELDE